MKLAACFSHTVPYYREGVRENIRNQPTFFSIGKKFDLHLNFFV